MTRNDVMMGWCAVPMLSPSQTHIRARFISSLFIVTFGLFLGVSLPASASRVAITEPGQQVNKALRKEGMTGIVWGVVDRDRIVAGAQGTSNNLTGAAMRADHRVHVGSIAKTIMALGVLRLASEGRLRLDEPVERILPFVKFDNRWASTNPVTIRHLLDHTAGLEDARLWHIFSARTAPNDPLQQMLLRDRSILTVRTRPGEIFSYSNFGYSLLGMVVERVARTRYEHYLDRNILAPLGMSSSTTLFTVQDPRGQSSRLAYGHLDNGAPVAAMAVAVRPASQLTTTAHDMALLARFLMGDGTASGVRIVTQDLLSAMAVPQHAAAKAGLSDGYALGLGHFDRAGQSGRCHGGDTIGFRAMLCIYPEQKMAFFRAINIDKEGANYRQFDEILIASLRLPHRRLPALARRDDSATDWNGQYVPLTTRVAIGRYPELLSEGFRFRGAGESAGITQDDGKTIRLHFVGNGLLRADGRVGATHVLHGTVNGEKRISTDMRTFRKAHWLERPGLWISLVAGASGLGYLLFAAPVLAWRRGQKRMNALHFVFAIGTLAGVLLYLQPFQSLGDPTGGSILLAIATAALPIALIWQGVTGVRSKRAGWLPEVIACLAGLQWIGTLAGYGLVPLILWN